MGCSKMGIKLLFVSIFRPRKNGGNKVTLFGKNFGLGVSILALVVLMSAKRKRACISEVTRASDKLTESAMIKPNPLLLKAYQDSAPTYMLHSVDIYFLPQSLRKWSKMSYK